MIFICEAHKFISRLILASEISFNLIIIIMLAPFIYLTCTIFRHFESFPSVSRK